MPKSSKPTTKDILCGISDKIEEVRLLLESDFDTKEALVSLMRHKLGSIDLSDTKENIPEDSGERMEYLSRIAGIISPAVGDRVKKMIADQLNFMAMEAVNNEQVWFAKGTVNGMLLLAESFEREKMEFIEKSKKPEPFDRSKILNSLIVE